ncbi:MAG: hypothetical protein E4G89_02460 [Methanothrix sp.]|nr:MAG: hypothetical protein E4G89_02460 [Methanothrix sp.]
MPDNDKISSVHSNDKSGDSYLFGWLALFIPCPELVFSTNHPHRETTWQQWITDNRYHHGLAKFALDLNGLTDPAPISSILREKPKAISSRQYGGRC